jgi:hypothetical protein
LIPLVPEINGNIAEIASRQPACSRIYAAHVLDCKTDEQAIGAAQKYVDGYGVPLWNRDRKIAEFLPQKVAERSRGFLNPAR